MSRDMAESGMILSCLDDGHGCLAANHLRCEEHNPCNPDGTAWFSKLCTTSDKISFFKADNAMWSKGNPYRPVNDSAGALLLLAVLCGWLKDSLARHQLAIYRGDGRSNRRQQ
jgi:hypothetical protein